MSKKESCKHCVLYDAASNHCLQTKQKVFKYASCLKFTPRMQKVWIARDSICLFMSKQKPVYKNENGVYITRGEVTILHGGCFNNITTDMPPMQATILVDLEKGKT